MLLPAGARERKRCRDGRHDVQRAACRVEPGGSVDEVQRESGAGRYPSGRTPAANLGPAVRGDGGERLRRVERALRRRGPAPVVDPVGQVGRLLHLVQQDARPHRVQRSRREHHRVTGGHALACQERRRGRALPDRLPEVGLADARPGTDQQLGLGLGLEHVPRLGLADGVGAGQLAAERVAGMDLHGQPRGGIEELDQERKARAGTGGRRGADELRPQRVRDVLEGAPGVRTARHRRPRAGDPQLPDREGLRRPEPGATPHALLRKRDEAQGSQHVPEPTPARPRPSPGANHLSGAGPVPP